MNEVMPSIGAAVAGAVIVCGIGQLWREPEWLLLVTFLIGLLGLVLMAVLPWPTVGERLVWGAIGGMVGSAVTWYNRWRRSRAAR